MQQNCKLTHSMDVKRSIKIIKLTPKYSKETIYEAKFDHFQFLWDAWKRTLWSNGDLSGALFLYWSTV